MMISICLSLISIPCARYTFCTSCNIYCCVVSESVAQALYDMSDHLPVTLELQTTETLSLADLIYNNDIKILGPNIVSEQLQLQISNSDINALTVYNAIGQNVLQIKTNNKISMSIDISKLASGIYYVKSSNTLIEPLKFIIQ